MHRQVQVKHWKSEHTRLYLWLTLNRGMQDCFRQHPDMYGSELEDDEDELEEELRAEDSPGSSDASGDMTTAVKGQPQPSQPAAQKGSKPAMENSKSSTKPTKAGDEGGELIPKAAHDGKSK
jgi:mitochondrial intermembrane space import and assembly protein 40